MTATNFESEFERVARELEGKEFRAEVEMMTPSELREKLIETQEYLRECEDVIQEYEESQGALRDAIKELEQDPKLRQALYHLQPLFVGGVDIKLLAENGCELWQVDEASPNGWVIGRVLGSGDCEYLTEPHPTAREAINAWYFAQQEVAND